MVKYIFKLFASIKSNQKLKKRNIEYERTTKMSSAEREIDGK